jgi:hypothetical protein
MKQQLQTFLQTEISDQDFYDGIFDFIMNGNIRCGEYECNQCVVKKMDLLNFIVFEEYVIDGNREIHQSFSIGRSKLIGSLNESALKQGFDISAAIESQS